MLQKLYKMKNDRHFGEIFKGSVLSLGAKVCATGITLVVNVLIARYYGAEAMGVLALVNAFLLLATIVSLFGTNTSILRFIPEQIAKHSVSSAYRLYRKIIWMVCSGGGILSLLLIALSGMIVQYIFEKPNLQGVIALSSGFIILRALSELTAQSLRGLKLQKAYAFMQVAPTLSMLIMLLCIMAFRHKPDDPVYAQLISFSLAALLGLVWVDKFFKERMQADDIIVSPPYAEIVSISLPMLMSGSMGFLIGQSGVIILGIFRPEVEVGIYSVAVKLASLTTFALQAINSMAAPKFSELYHQGKIDVLLEVARKSSKLIFWTTTPLLLVLLLFGKGLLALIFGSAFVAAYEPMTMLVVGQFVVSLSGSTAFFMIMTGEEKTFGKIILVTAMMNVLITYLLVPRFGLLGAAFASMISISGCNIYIMFYQTMKLGKNIFYFPLISRYLIKN